VESGQFVWVDGGAYLTSTCHVANVCEGALLAAEKGRGGEAYFLTDGGPVIFRDFITAMLQTQRVNPGNRSIPGWLARGLARVFEAVWDPLGLPGEPPITLTAAKLLFEEVTVNDAKARRELGYAGRMTREEGLYAMRVT
jgi:nucleoside-diphosphate-sugar epimerase